MSTGLECMFVERRTSEWYYVLQDWDCPVGAWDWREYATAYGPFRSEDSAIEHLGAHHANPGGWSTYSLVDRRDEEDGVLAKLFEEANARFGG